MTTHEQPAPAYTDVEQANDPGAGTGIAEKAPAEQGTLSTAADEREPSGEQSTSGAPVVPGSDSGDQGFPSGSTDTPAADTGGRRDGADADAPLRHGLSGRAGSDPDEWPASGTSGVSGSAPGDADLESSGQAGLTTTDTEGGDR